MKRLVLTLFIITGILFLTGCKQLPDDTLPVTYTIRVNPISAENGESLTADVSEAAEGTTVTLIAALNSGRQVELSTSGVTIIPSTISSDGGTASFTMPADAVEITATFYSYAKVEVSHTAYTVRFDMRFVPSGGTFNMGENVESTTQYATLTRNFWIGETEVTQGLWEDVWGTTWPGTDPDGSGYGAGKDYPAYYVNWYDAVAFCNLLTQADSSIPDSQQVYYSDSGLTTAYTKANASSKVTVYFDWKKTGYRLPTEAEWEYAARYIDGTSWNGGDHVSGGPVYTDEIDPDKIGDYAWYSGNNSGSNGDPTYGTKEVGQKEANALGLHDMSGNVCEWCYDWYGSYSGGSEKDPTGSASGSDRVYRGGRWNHSVGGLRSALRFSYGGSAIRSYVIGFRLCKTADDILETPYGVTVTSVGAERGESLTADVSEAAEGSTVTLTASLNSGRQVELSASGVTISPSTISTNGEKATFTMPAGAVELTATFSNIIYPIIVLPSGAANGESVSANLSEAIKGTTVTLTASLNSDRKVELSASGVYISPSTISTNGGKASFTMPAGAAVVTATFSDTPATAHTVTVLPYVAESGESVSVNVSEAIKGTIVTLTASLNSGRQVELSASGVTISPSTISTNGGKATFTMPAGDVGVTATFSDIIYPIIVLPSGAANGESLTANLSEAIKGTTVTLTASLNSDRKVELSASGVTISPSTISTNGGKATFTMPAGAVEITATFSDIIYAITVSPSGAASGESVSANVSAAIKGTTVTLTASLNSGRQVELSASGVTISPSTISTNGGKATFTMPAGAVEITATFSDIIYAITVSPSGAASGESLTANVSEAIKGTTVTLTASLNSDRKVELSASGVTISPSTISTNGGKATFTMPADAVEITATFSFYAGAAVSHTANTVSFNMHFVPSGGPFTLGEDVVSPTQDVTLTRNFWMGETEVTQVLWEDVWGSPWPGTDPGGGLWPGTDPWGSGNGSGANYPAYYLSWYDAVAFCNLLTQADDSIADSQQVYYSDSGMTTPYTKTNAVSSSVVYVDWNKTGYRLPTEAEWEYAARYIDGTSLNGGDHVSGGPVYTDKTYPDTIGDYAWYQENANGIKEVGQKKANALGLRDMSGNVFEWCYNWDIIVNRGWRSEPGSGSTRVYRGGSYEGENSFLRCACRASNYPELRYEDSGFRLCRTAD